MRAEVGPARTARLWVPQQHGAWAILALPILVGALITLVAVATLPLAYAALGAGLTARAAALPLVRCRLGATGRGPSGLLSSRSPPGRRRASPNGS